MKTGSFLVSVALLLLLTAVSADAATRYVWQESPNPTPPYTSWATAARVIQEAVDASQDGDTVLVHGGVYATGGRAAYGTMTNRVAIDRAITVESLLGPALTFIQGYQVPGRTIGDGAIRCVYLTNGARLAGFTLTNGATGTSGSTNVQFGGGLWCESTKAVVSNCVLTGNSAIFGGGAYRGTLTHSTLTDNYAFVVGGGAYQSTVSNCVLTGNSAFYGGGGAYQSTLNNCRLTENSASSGGGGAMESTLNNCMLASNRATGENMAPGESSKGGGANGGTLNNCTLTGNSADFGGGACQSTLNNCLVYFNTAFILGPNHWGSTLNYCCTTPLPPHGFGNISTDPRMLNPPHLTANSPCRGAGNSAYATGTDIEGKPWATSPSIGCDEFHPVNEAGPLSVVIAPTLTNVATAYPVQLTALVEGRATASVWEFGDGLIASNQLHASHAWAAPATYQVVFRAYNESFPTGISATTAVRVVTQPVHYVVAHSGSPVPPYASWASAARTIQDAVDGATVPGSLVLVTNGAYTIGGRAVHGTMTNRVAVDKPLILRSVSGPQFTTILGSEASGGGNGEGAIRCVYLTNGASLSGFMLTLGATGVSGDSRENSGGAVWCESADAMISDCVLIGNSALDGGGVHRGTLNQCTLINNSAWDGGGAYQSSLNSCILAVNSAVEGGGAYQSILDYCTLTDNAAIQEGSGGGTYDCALNYCTLADNSAPYGGGADSSTLHNCTLVGNSAGGGGGAYLSTLHNCTLVGNSAGGGGGVSLSTLNNCILTENSASWGGGGGASGGTLNNCILYFNSATSGANYSMSTLNYCCTTPLPTNGMGHVTSEPLFIDASAGNLRLQPNSPCINAGHNAFATGLTDLDGNPRIVAGTVDIGAYEYQTPSSVISYAWLQQYGLPTDGSADYTDFDHDLVNTWQEWRAGTHPTDALSVLRLLTPSVTPSGVLLGWTSVTNRAYFIERFTDPVMHATLLLLESNLAGQAGLTSYTDTTAVGLGSFFYRVGVHE